MPVSILTANHFMTDSTATGHRGISDRQSHSVRASTMHLQHYYNIITTVLIQSPVNQYRTSFSKGDIAIQVKHRWVFD